MTHSTEFGQRRMAETAGGEKYEAFFPAEMPLSVDLSKRTVGLLAEAEAAVGRLEGTGRLLSNPNLLIRPYLFQEAVSSTRIEGTLTTLGESFLAEVADVTQGPDTEEVLNYVRAMTDGVALLEQSNSFGLDMMCRLHEVLLAGVRGRNRNPGQVRTTQNWIGPPNAKIKEASFVPPPPEEVGRLLDDWIRFATGNSDIPVLIQSGMLHYQFETIHPYDDGNGRLGRLLIVLHFIYRKRLSRPFLYLSSYFEDERPEYIAWLNSVRQQGDLDGWVGFYLKGVIREAEDALGRMRQLIDMRESYRERILSSIRGGTAIAICDQIFANPILTASRVVGSLHVSTPTALAALEKMMELRILEEMEPGPRKQRRFVAEEVMSILDDDWGMNRSLILGLGDY